MSYSLGETELIPSMTSADEQILVNDWNGDTIWFKQRYKGGFPSTCLYQLIVYMCYDVIAEYMCQKGAILENKYLGIKFLIYIEYDSLNIRIKGDKDNAGHYLAFIRNYLEKIKSKTNLKCIDEIGFEKNNEWYFLGLNRVLLMLSKDIREDFVYVLNERIDIWDVLSAITPDSIIKKIREELQNKENSLENRNLNKI